MGGLLGDLSLQPFGPGARPGSPPHAGHLGARGMGMEGPVLPLALPPPPRSAPGPAPQPQTRSEVCGDRLLASDTPLPARGSSIHPARGARGSPWSSLLFTRQPTSRPARPPGPSWPFSEAICRQSRESPAGAARQAEICQCSYQQRATSASLPPTMVGHLVCPLLPLAADNSSLNYIFSLN